MNPMVAGRLPSLVTEYWMTPCAFTGTLPKAKFGGLGIIDKIAPWVLEIDVAGAGIFTISFAQREVQRGRPASAPRLVLSIEADLLVAHLARALHWNNSQIGCFLSWQRHPNDYNPFLYDALNFFHLPLGIGLKDAASD